MSSPKISFRSRLLVMISIFLLLMAGTALFTETKVREVAETNHQTQLHYHKHKITQNQLFWTLIEVEKNIHSYTLDPNPEKGHQLIKQVEAIYPHIADLEGHLSEKEQDKRIDILSDRLKSNVQDVEQAVRILISYLNLPEKRFPAMTHMIEEMFPLREDIVLALNLALQEEPNKETDFQQIKIRELFFKLRYYWNQQINLTRLFIANRSSVFGSPLQGMESSLAQRKQYIATIDNLLQQLQGYDNNDELELQQSESLTEIIAKVIQFEQSFTKTAQIYLSDNWRMDGQLMTKQVNPAMAKLWKTMRNIEEHLDKEIENALQGTMGMIETVSVFLWFFLVVSSALSVLLYLLFEKSIRLPIIKVATALDSVAQGDEQIKLPAANTLETELLINAFGNMREQVKSRQNRLNTILDNTHDGIITIDEKGSIETFNNAAERLYGYQAEEILGKNVKCLMPEPDCSRHDGYLKRYCTTDQAKVLGKEFERIACRKDGSEFPVSIKSSEIFLEGKRFFTAVTADISERRELMDRLKHLAERDPLTGLYNRRYFSEELSRTQDRILRGSMQCALLFIDLDNFKYVNDTMGHPAGDQVLLDITDILKQRSRSGDLLARQGGDEFAVLLYDIDKKEA